MCRRSCCPRGFFARRSCRSLATALAEWDQEAFAGTICSTQLSVQCIHLHREQLGTANDTVWTIVLLHFCLVDVASVIFGVMVEQCQYMLRELHCNCVLR